MKHTPVKLWRTQKEFSAQLGTRGKILYHTIIRTAPKGFAESAPYPVIIVQLENGEKTIGQLVDAQIEKIKSGQKVVTAFRRAHEVDDESIIPYCIKFKPIS